ncbi:hypothetical protein ES707_08078 [subsurface metagenome]
MVKNQKQALSCLLNPAPPGRGTIDFCLGCSFKAFCMEIVAVLLEKGGTGEMLVPGHIQIRGEIIRVICLQEKNRRVLRLRKTGEPGIFLEEEAHYLKQVQPDLVKKLKRGQIISF